MLAPKELRAVHPLGKSPVITDGGDTVAESGAIIEYLVEHLRRWSIDPAAGHAGAAALHLLAALCRRLGDAAAAVEVALHADAEARSRAAAPGWCAKSLLAGLDDAGRSAARAAPGILEGGVGQSEWFAGNDFTAADIQMSFPLEAAAARGGLEQGHPGRWRSSTAFTPGLPISAHWSRAAPTRSRADVYCVAAIASSPDVQTPRYRRWDRSHLRGERSPCVATE